MKMLIFSGLFVFIVFKSLAITINVPGSRVQVSCSDERRERPLAQIIPQAFGTGWEPHFIYPIRICVRLESSQFLQSCALTNNSQISVQIGNFSRDKCELLTAPLKLEHFKTTNTHCHVFTVPEIANNCRGKNLTDTKLYVQALLYATQERGKPQSHIAVFAHFEEYFFNEPGSKTSETAETPEEGEKPTNVGLHAVVCNFPNCIVTAEKPFIANKTERFRVKSGDAPIYVPGTVPLSHQMFSVTYFYCNEENCPKVFKAKEQKPTPDTTTTSKPTTSKASTSELTSPTISEDTTAEVLTDAETPVVEAEETPATILFMTTKPSTPAPLIVSGLAGSLLLAAVVGGGIYAAYRFGATPEFKLLGQRTSEIQQSMSIMDDH